MRRSRATLQLAVTFVQSRSPEVMFDFLFFFSVFKQSADQQPGYISNLPIDSRAVIITSLLQIKGYNMDSGPLCMSPAPRSSGYSRLGCHSSSQTCCGRQVQPICAEEAFSVKWLPRHVLLHIHQCIAAAQSRCYLAELCPCLSLLLHLPRSMPL